MELDHVAEPFPQVSRALESRAVQRDDPAGFPFGQVVTDPIQGLAVIRPEVQPSDNRQNLPLPAGRGRMGERVQQAGMTASADQVESDSRRADDQRAVVRNVIRDMVSDVPFEQIFVGECLEVKNAADGAGHEKRGCRGRVDRNP